MKKHLFFIITLALSFSYIYPQASDDVNSLKNLLNNLSSTTDNMYFKIHCNSILTVIDAKKTLTKTDSSLLSGMYKVFSNESLSSDASRLSSYTNRKRPFIISWKSSADNEISLAWLILPDNWDPQGTYPLYLRLHGLASVYTNPIEYMTYYFKPSTEVAASFNDGYILLPWARGNNWYMDIGETDVLESLDVIKNMINIDPYRQYLVGFSMGGFGTWYLGEKYYYMWAGLGIIAGALNYDNTVFNSETAFRLQNIPVYIACGQSDDLQGTNLEGFQYLQNTGNPDIVYRTFVGGHDAPLAEWQLMYEWLKDFTNTDYNEIKHPGENISSNVSVFPNPFCISTTINYLVLKPGKTEISIFNSSGQKVWNRLCYNEFAGEKSISWVGNDNSGNTVTEGIYFCNIRNAEYSSAVKIILLK